MWLLVETHPDLEQLPGEPRKTSRTAVFRGIVQVPGVARCVDPACVSRATLEEWIGAQLIPDAQVEAVLHPPPRKKRVR
jgi:hypothetical protein